MKRSGCLLVFAALLALPAFAEEPMGEPQQVQRPNARGLQQNQAQQQPANAQAQQPNGVQQRIAELYVSTFISEVELTDDQFLRIGNFVRQYIRKRFNVAEQGEAIKQQLDQLSSQPSPSESDVAALIEAKTRVDRVKGNAESVFLDEIRPTLTAKQVALFYSFNHVFFEERLPGLIQRAKAAAAERGQAPGRPNLNNQNPNNQIQRQNNPNRPGNALRQNKQGQN